MKQEGELLSKAQNNFNLEQYFENYSCNMDAYLADNEYADKYFNQIKIYYNNHVPNYVEYLTKLLVAGE